MRKIFFSLLAAVFLFATACSTDSGKVVIMKTNLGDISIELSDKTPRHNENFLKLAKEGYYNGMLFHRVVQDFIIQSGDPETRDTSATGPFGTGGPGYELEAEIDPSLFHAKGVIAAARLGDAANPEYKSSGSQFYIAVGKVYTDEELSTIEQYRNQQVKNEIMLDFFKREENADLKRQMMEMQKSDDKEAMNKFGLDIEQRIEKEYLKAQKFTITPEQRKIYTTVGGVPPLDGTYTIFGKVTAGMDIVDKIATADLDQHGQPKEDIRIIEIVVQ